jgi:hypothetical protein
LSTARQRLRNVFWDALTGMAAGVIGEPAFGHSPMGVWFFAAAVAAGSLSGLSRPVRRAPELYWSGLLDWCFASSHAVYPRN